MMSHLKIFIESVLFGSSIVKEIFCLLEEHLASSRKFIEDAIETTFGKINIAGETYTSSEIIEIVNSKT